MIVKMRNRDPRPRDTFDRLRLFHIWPIRLLPSLFLCQKIPSDAFENVIPTFFSVTRPSTRVFLSYFFFLINLHSICHFEKLD